MLDLDLVKRLVGAFFAACAIATLLFVLQILGLLAPAG